MVPASLKSTPEQHSQIFHPAFIQSRLQHQVFIFTMLFIAMGPVTFGWVFCLFVLMLDFPQKVGVRFAIYFNTLG